MYHFLFVAVALLGLLSFPLPTMIFSQPRYAAGAPVRANQESPGEGSVESGIGLIRGWICEAAKVEIEIDGGNLWSTAYGTQRGDTEAVCGDTNNGYGLTFNHNRLGDGNHTLRALADGVEFSKVHFYVATMGENLLQGVRAEYTLSDFPRPGCGVKIRWSEAHQNFVIAESSCYPIFGLNFGPYVDGQDPNRGLPVEEEQLIKRMEPLKTYTKWIRTFGSTRGLEKSGRIARTLNLKAALGAWIGGDSDSNEREISHLIAAAKAGDADLLIVGSEVLDRNDLSVNQIITYINRVKQAVPDIPIGYADTYEQILNHPNYTAMVDALDVILVNYYPYWQGIPVENAVSAIHDWHQQVLAAARGKSVIVSETGWPSAGDTVGQAVPSLENACFYFLGFTSWAKLNQVNYFYFEAYDEPWKASYEGPQGAHWGIWDRSGALKPCMQAVFDGQMGVNSDPGSESPDAPLIEFTDVPSLGGFENLGGRVQHVNPADYKVAVYIYVSGGWWTKPYWDRPLTSIQEDGAWICDITTGGIDQHATKIAAFLIPKGYNPPLMGGEAGLPAVLAQNAVAKVEVNR